jgi:hypothetical protein
MCSGEPKSRPSGDVAAASPAQLWAHADLAYPQPTTRTGARGWCTAKGASANSGAWALFSALHRPAPLSAAKGSPLPRRSTARDRRQGHTRPDTNSAVHPGCRGLWFVKRQGAPDQQRRVGRPQHARTQLTRCRVASKPNGLRLLQGACEPSRSMFPLRARATRVRGVPQPFRASKGSALAAGAGEGDDETPKGPSVLGCRIEGGEKSRGVRCHAQTTASTGDSADKLWDAFPAPVYRPPSLLTRLPEPLGALKSGQFPEFLGS